MSQATHAAECFWPGVSRKDVERIDRDLAASDRDGSTYIGATLVPEDEIVFVWFAARSGEEVQLRVAQVGAPVYRVVVVEETAADYHEEER